VLVQHFPVGASTCHPPIKHSWELLDHCPCARMRSIRDVAESPVRSLRLLWLAARRAYESEVQYAPNQACKGSLSRYTNVPLLRCTDTIAPRSMLYPILNPKNWSLC
jgi:hypothetical protein